MGPLMLDVAGCELTADERDVLDHPLVGGVILFSRNYHDQTQLSELIKQLRHACRNDIIIATDHEGGRVQRFREQFSPIPAMGSLYTRAVGDMDKACHYAQTFGWLMAAELLAFDIDISFAPVLDIWGISEVIGDRSFHAEPEIVVQLAAKFIDGMRHAGMKATGKHFPGHGNVREDSHVAIPVDTRPKDEIINRDMRIFSEVNQAAGLDAVMPAHVIYPEVDAAPAGFSSVWIRQYLRNSLNFDGVVFSDDLSMAGAAQIGSFPERARSALTAGCDMVLVCNDAKGAIAVLDDLPSDYQASARLPNLKARRCDGWQKLINTDAYKQALAQLDEFYAN